MKDNTQNRVTDGVSAVLAGAVTPRSITMKKAAAIPLHTLVFTGRTTERDLRGERA